MEMNKVIDEIIELKKSILSKLREGNIKLENKYYSMLNSRLDNEIQNEQIKKIELNKKIKMEKSMITKYLDVGQGTPKRKYKKVTKSVGKKKDAIIHRDEVDFDIVCDCEEFYMN